MSTKPRILSGFMELLPEDQLQFNKLVDVIRKNYESYGFLPLDTPVIELSEVLLAKAGGETEKQIYRFSKGDTDMSLRFDLTVPLARYVSMNYNNLVFPFKRYQIGKVYRGERPQKGRYREFYQCDIDIIGDGELPLVYDAEIPSVIYNIFKELDFGKFVIKMNNRKVLNGFFSSLGIDNPSDILRIIDKIEKIGEDSVRDLLSDIDIDSNTVDKILSFIKIDGSALEIISSLKGLDVDNDLFNSGVLEMEELEKNIKLFNIPSDYYKFDLTIARGLDYYTGVVYETNLVDYPELGSVCSGGKYDDLTGYYSNQKLPGIGISIGLTRLYSKLREMDLIKVDKKSNIDVLVIPFNSEYTANAVSVANTLRSNNLVPEVYYLDKKMGQKFKYADRIGVSNVVILGSEEVSSNKVTLKNMESGNQEMITVEELIKRVS